MNAATYTTNGPIRGTCGHNHRAIASAVKCAKRDVNGCTTQGGYSDREVERTDGLRMSTPERDRLASALYLNMMPLY